MFVVFLCFVVAFVNGNELDATETPRTCPKNERWVDCELGYCEAKTCDQLGLPLPCPGIAPPCLGGCICIEGYLRNKENVCVHKSLCPSCAGDYNATAGRGRHCGKLCSNYEKADTEPVNCEMINYEYDLCDCKEGYVYNDRFGQCVEPKDCPKPCKGDHYAENKQCVSLCQPTCANPDPGNCNTTCIENGCECTSGYVLNKPNGKCVKIDKCEENLGCNGDPNAIITSCTTLCPSICEEPEPTFCAAICLPLGCRCKSNYIMSKKEGRCIPSEKCDQWRKANGHPAAPDNL